MIRNKDAIIANGASTWHQGARRVLLDLLESGLRAVDPATAVRRHVSVEGSVLRVRGEGVAVDRDMQGPGRVVVLGGGKATAAMATAVESILGNWLSSGVIVVPGDAAASFPSGKIRSHAGGHPIPNRAGMQGVDAMIDLAKSLVRDDVAICLVSGGGSALMPRPAGDITLEDKQELNKVLLACGASIHEINAVRKHVSLIKGGWLARHASPAAVISLVLSDVVGDDLATIASGPTVPDPTTFSDAVSCLKRRQAWDAVPPRVRAYLQAGLANTAMETPKPGDPALDRVVNVLIGSAATAAGEIVRVAGARGIDATHVVTNHLDGEAREAGDALATLVSGAGTRRISFPASGTWFSGREMTIHVDRDAPGDAMTLLLFTGETTVTLRGKGTGGRNQEMLLATLGSLRGRGQGGRFALLACGMDGMEGNSPAAGAIIDDGSATRAEAKGLDALGMLASNDSHRFFTGLGDAILTGPTGTNVNDVIMLLVEGRWQDVVVTRDRRDPSPATIEAR